CAFHAARKAGLMATVSTRALMVVKPPFRSFAHGGIKPQRSLRSSSLSPSPSTTAARCVGARLYFAVMPARSSASSGQDAWLLSKSGSWTKRPHISLELLFVLPTAPFCAVHGPYKPDGKCRHANHQSVWRQNNQNSHVPSPFLMGILPDWGVVIL